MASRAARAGGRVGRGARRRSPAGSDGDGGAAPVGHWDGAAATRAADALRGKAAPLAPADVAPTKRCLDRAPPPRTSSRSSGGTRSTRSRAPRRPARDRARTGAEVASLGALDAAENGNPNLRGDAVTGAVLAAAAAAGGATLVEINLAAEPRVTTDSARPHPCLGRGRAVERALKRQGSRATLGRQSSWRRWSSPPGSRIARTWSPRCELGRADGDLGLAVPHHRDEPRVLREDEAPRPLAVPRSRPLPISTSTISRFSLRQLEQVNELVLRHLVLDEAP